MGSVGYPIKCVCILIAQCRSSTRKFPVNTTLKNQEIEHRHLISNRRIMVGKADIFGPSI